jgi:hypothetical protein
MSRHGGLVPSRRQRRSINSDISTRVGAILLGHQALVSAQHPVVMVRLGLLCLERSWTPTGLTMAAGRQSNQWAGISWP